MPVGDDMDPRQHRLGSGVGRGLRLDARRDAHGVAVPSEDADAAVPLPIDGDRASAQLHRDRAHLARPAARVVAAASVVEAALEPVGVALLAGDLSVEEVGEASRARSGEVRARRMGSSWGWPVLS